MRLLTFNDIQLPTRMVTYTLPRTSNVATVRVTGGYSYGLGAYMDWQEYGCEGIYYDASPNWVRDSVLDDLRACMGSPYVLRGQALSGQVRRATAYLTSVEGLHDISSQATGVQNVSLRFSAQPNWYDDSERVETLTSASTLYVVNNGNRATTNLKLTITSALSANFMLTNTTNDQTFEYSPTKSGGTSLVIDAGNSAVTLDDTSVYGSTVRAATQIEFMALETGLNVLTFSQAITGEFRFRGCWV